MNKFKCDPSANVFVQKKLKKHEHLILKFCMNEEFSLAKNHKYDIK